MGHQKIRKTESGYTGILVMIDHYTKLAEAIPCMDYTAVQYTAKSLDFQIWYTHVYTIRQWSAVYHPHDTGIPTSSGRVSSFINHLPPQDQRIGGKTE